MQASPRRAKRWTSFRHLLPGVLNDLPEDPDQPEQRLQAIWVTVVGRQLAAHSRVRRVTDKTLFVQVEAEAWRTALKSLETRVLHSINRTRSGTPLTTVRYQIENNMTETPTTMNTPILISSQPRPQSQPPEDLHLEPVQDPELKATLGRLAEKLRFVSVAFLAVLLANCAGVGSGGNNGLGPTPQFTGLDNAPSVRIIQRLNEKEPGRYRDPRSYYHYLKSLEYEREGDFDLATNHYKKVVEHDPNNEKFLTHLVSLFQRTGRLDEALETGKRALDRFPNNSEIRRVVADIYSSRGQHENALEQYRTLADKNPTDGETFLLMGYTLRALGNNHEAGEWLAQAVSIKPSSTLAHFIYGNYLLESGDLEGATEKFKKSLSLRPSFLEPRQKLAHVLESQKNYTEALAQYRILLKLKPESEALAEHFNALNEVWDPVTETINGSVAPFALENKDPDIHLLIGTIYFERVMYLEAVDQFRLVLAREENRDVRFGIARIYEVLGRPDKAIKEIETYREKSKEPDTVEVLLKLARLYGLEENMAASVMLLKEASDKDPHNDRLLHALGLAYMSLNRDAEALDTIEKAIALNPKRDTYYFEKGALLERLNRYEDAIASMKQTLEINPNHSNAHNFIGYLYATRNVELDKALNHLERAISIQPRNGYFLDSLGWIYYKKGDMNQALTHIKRAMVYAEPDPVLYDHLGDVYFSMEKFFEARKAWKTSLALTLRKLKNPSGEIPVPDELEEKIRKADQQLHSY